MYFSGQGKLLVATRGSNGKPGVFRYVGNVPSLKVSLSVDKIQHHESVSGQRLLDFQMVKEQKCTVDFDLEEFSPENLALALYGTAAAAGTTPLTITGEALPNPVAVGDYLRLDNPNISALVITDSSSTPKPAVLGTDYVVESAAHGTIQWLSDPTTGGTAFQQPFNAAYSSAGAENVTFFAQPPMERWFRFEGLNTADTVNGSKVLVEVYRVILDPMKELDLINDDLAKFSMTGSALYDATAVQDAALGPFGRLMQL